MSDQVTGVVKWFNPEKAYGFITIPDGVDVFVHRRAIADDRADLVDGQEVSFSMRPSAKGYEAFDVRVTKDAEIPPSRRRQYQNSTASTDNRASATRPGPYDGPLPEGPVFARVKRFDASGRFLFVKTETDGIDVFVHGSVVAAVRDALNEGDRVQIVVESSDRGPRAEWLELAPANHASAPELSEVAVNS